MAAPSQFNIVLHEGAVKNAADAVKAVMAKGCRNRLWKISDELC